MDDTDSNLIQDFLASGYESGYQAGLEKALISGYQLGSISSFHFYSKIAFYKHVALLLKTNDSIIEKLVLQIVHECDTAPSTNDKTSDLSALLKSIESKIKKLQSLLKIQVHDITKGEQTTTRLDF